MTGSVDRPSSYLERRRRRRRLWLAGIALAALLVVVTARRPDLEDPCRPATASSAELALLPAGLTLAELGTVTDVREEEQHVLVEAVTTKPVDEAAVLVQDAVTAAGYRPAGMDNEGGLEAEVFFTRGTYAAGQARVQQSTCAGRSDVELVLLDPDAVPPR